MFPASIITSLACSSMTNELLTTMGGEIGHVVAVTLRQNVRATDKCRHERQPRFHSQAPSE
jgi:hypothetical protein